MRLFISLVFTMILLIFPLISLYQFNPLIYEGVKITDWISSIFTMFSFLAAIAAIYYAKNYLGQERHKNASNFAIDILHKDMVLLSSLQQQQQLLFLIENRTHFFIHSTNNQTDEFCIKYFASAYLNMGAVVEAMDKTTELVANDIFKARIVGCTLKDQNNNVILNNLNAYTELKDTLSRLGILICSEIIPYYAFNIENINPDTHIQIYFPDQRGVERQEMFGEILGLIRNCTELILYIKSQLRELREGVSDLKEIFNFK